MIRLIPTYRSNCKGECVYAKNIIRKQLEAVAAAPAKNGRSLDIDIDNGDREKHSYSICI